MKNNILRSKLGIRFISLAAAMTLAAASLAGCGASAQDNSTEIVSEIENDEDSDTLQNMMEKQAGLTHTSSGDPSKEEVVYILADANGNRNEVIVSDWLKNTKAETTISDISNLTGITNVSGNEDYTVDENGNLTWNADGNDIHYQGTTDAELPVDVKVTYFLDGAEITPDELAGKSGKVTIRFDYTNNATKSVEIGGKEKEIYVPFTMMSGAVLDNDHFANIEVTNGRVISTGNTNLVMGMAFPGLADSLDIASLKDKIDDKELADDIDESKIPNYVEITADTVDFKMDQTMTMAFSDVLSSLNLDSELDLDTSDITDSMDELADASDKLVNGTSDLNDGAGELSDGAKTLAEKSKDLDEGASKLYNGAADLVSGASQLDNGAGTLLDGINQVDGGVATLEDGANKLNDGAGTLKSGADQLAAGTSELAGKAPELVKGAEQLNAGLVTAQSSVEQLSALADMAFYGPTHGGAYVNKAAAEAMAAQVAAQKKAAEEAAAAAGASSSSAVSEAKTLSLQTADDAANLESSINSVAGDLAAQIADWESLAATYESQISEYSAKVAADRDAINQIISNPNSEELQVVTGSNEATGEYTATTVVNKTVNTTTNNYYASEADEEGNTSDVLRDSNTETSEEESSESTETGYYSYTQYDTETRQVSSIDTAALQSAIDTYTADCEELSDIQASYTTYSYLASTISEYAGSLSSLSETAGALTNVAMLSDEGVAAAGDEASAAATEQFKKGVEAGQAAVLANQKEAAEKLTIGLYQLSGAMSSQIVPGASALTAGAQQASAGAAQLNDGAKKLAGGAGELKDGTSSLVTGAGTLKDGTTKLASGAGELKDGTSKLAEGSVTLQNGTAELKDGTSQFVDGTQTLYDGTLTLTDGTKELMDGMFRFKDEGIDKLTDIFGDDVQDVIDTLTVVMDAGKEYNIFSEASSDVDSSVKFIYKTESIK